MLRRLFWEPILRVNQKCCVVLLDFLTTVQLLMDYVTGLTCVKILQGITATLAASIHGYGERSMEVIAPDDRGTNPSTFKSVARLELSEGPTQITQSLVGWQGWKRRRAPSTTNPSRPESPSGRRALTDLSNAKPPTTVPSRLVP